MTSLPLFLLMNAWVVCIFFFVTMKKAVMNIYYTGLYVDISLNLPTSEISGSREEVYCSTL